MAKDGGRVLKGLKHGPPVWLVIPLAVLVGYARAIAEPSAGLDHSWTLGLSLARAQGLTWGTNLVYTYGPWGFVNAVVPLSDALVIQALAARLIVLCLVGYAVWCLTSEQGFWGAFVLSIFVASAAKAVGYAMALGCCVVLPPFVG